ncbi:MAG: hypothetical protein AAAFM81_12500 [Pseudomonadota bacterium]
MKEFLEALVSRAKSPVFGYVLIYFFVFNWDRLLLLLAGSDPIECRIALFKAEFSYGRTVFWPVVFASVTAVVYPWISVLFLKINSAAFDVRNQIHSETESQRLLRVKKLELERVAQFSAFEKAQILDLAKAEADLDEQGVEGEAREKAVERLDDLAKDVRSRRDGERIVVGSTGKLTDLRKRLQTELLFLDQEVEVSLLVKDSETSMEVLLKKVIPEGILREEIERAVSTISGFDDIAVFFTVPIGNNRKRRMRLR